MLQLNINTVRAWIKQTKGTFHYTEALDRSVDPSSYSHLRKIMHDLVQSGEVKPSGKRDGYYCAVEIIQPINWWNGEEGKAIPIVWPYGIQDGSSFYFNETIEVFYGDAIVIAGQPNSIKTGFAINFLVNNLHLFDGARMMVNEYKPERFRARMSKVNWVDYWNENKPKFELLPVMENHVDHIQPNFLNIIDWLHISENFWEVASQIQDMQMRLRKGILLVVLQKTTGKPWGVGADWGAFFPAIYLTIDKPYKLTVRKVKSPPPGGSNPEGRMFAFDVIDRGTKFNDIREVKNCPVCKGSRYAFGKECTRCSARGYVELD